MKLGIIGAGRVGVAVARYALRTGHKVVIASRRPESLTLALASIGPGAEAGSIREAAAADAVLLAVPWPAREEALSAVPDWSGKILIDATNPYAQMSPKLILADLGGRGSSEIVAGLARGARVVKAFNAITMQNFEAGPKRGDATRVLLVSGDDDDAKHVVIRLIEEFGFVVVDLGGLIEGGRRQQAGQPLATGRDLLVVGAPVAHEREAS